MIQRTISVRLILTALVISVLLFLVGVLVGNQIAQGSNQSLQNDLDALTVQTSFLELASLGSDAGVNQTLLCPVYADQLKAFDSQTEDFRLKLAYLKEKLGPSDPQVQKLSLSYAYLQARDYLNVRRINRACGNRVNVAVLFSSPHCAACDAELATLAQIKKESNFSVFVYSFDASQTNAAVDALKAIYGVGDTLPVTVLNEHVLVGSQVADTLRALLRH